MPVKRAARFVVYFRITRDRKGSNGWRLATQHKAVLKIPGINAWKSVGEFVEPVIQPGHDREQLKAAIHACRKYKASLIIAKLGRFGRNLDLIDALMKSGVEFLAADHLRANRRTIDALAQEEREQDTVRISAAMEAARARGKRLGNPRLREAALRGSKTIVSNADQFAANVLPIIRELQKSGVMSAKKIAEKLNDLGVETARGGKWTHVQVGNAVRRATAKRVAGIPA